MSKETREIAELIIAECTDVTGYVFAARMASAIDKALRDRDERAAKIAETAYEQYQTGYNAGAFIAKKIRNGVVDAK